jgi:hypothetical protein
VSPSRTVNKFHPWSEYCPHDQAGSPSQEEKPRDKEKDERQEKAGSRNPKRNVALFPSDNVASMAKVTAKHAQVLLDGVENRLEGINRHAPVRLGGNVNVVSKLLHLPFVFLLRFQVFFISLRTREVER